MLVFNMLQSPHWHKKVNTGGEGSDSLDSLSGDLKLGLASVSSRTAFSALTTSVPVEQYLIFHL
jgi:hypothetical protein